LQASRTACRETPAILLDCLADRFQRFESGSFLDRMDANAFGCTVIDCRKDRHLTLGLGGSRSGIGSPHLIRSFGDNDPFVRIAAHWLRLAGRRKELVLPQQA
jgi:hypothetical protein